MAKLPILMYHNISPEASSGLTIQASRLEEQFADLQANGYQSLHFSDLQGFKSAADFPKKAVILTFDDVYVNQLEYAYPLLQKYGLKACFYIPFQYVNAKDHWNTGEEAIMSIDQLKSLDPKTIELGLHSFAHGRYSEMSVDEVQADFDKCKSYIQEHQLNIHNTLAYPYGKYPRKGLGRQEFFETLHQNQIAYGLRIGNRVNRYPFKNNYEIQRIDIKGEDSLVKFKLKLSFGKLGIF